MKIFIAALAVLLSFTSHSQHHPLYVAAKTGLSIREKPDPSSTVLDKIPYGTNITLVDEDGGWETIITEQLTGYWRKVKYKNKTGYIVDSYLLPWPPPKLATAKNMKQYLAQVTIPFGQKLVTRSDAAPQLSESGWRLGKQLYKNGAEHHDFLAYEYASDTYFLPGFSLQQGFLLLRLLPEFNDVFGEKDEFPTASKTISKNGREYDIRLFRTVDDPEYGGPFTIEKIRISYDDGASYVFEMYMQENQLVVFLSGGL